MGFVKFKNQHVVSETLIGTDLNADGDTDDLVTARVFFVRKNPADDQLKEVPIEYP